MVELIIDLCKNHFCIFRKEFLTEMHTTSINKGIKEFLIYDLTSSDHHAMMGL